GDRFVPQPVTRGPWDSRAMNGGAAVLLVARAAERHEDAGAPHLDGHLVARLTVDLVRPAPMVPLEVRTTTLRPGRKIQLVEVLLLAGDDVVTRGLALRMPAAEPDVEPTHEDPPPGPDTAVPRHRSDAAGEGEGGPELFHAHGVDMRII